MNAPRKQFWNKNAIPDAKHDARHKLGNCNQYTPGSLSWRKYEEAYALEKAIVDSIDDHGENDYECPSR